MTPEPTVQPLTHTKRTWFFRGLCVIFFVAMPIFVFYAMGYRIDLSNTSNITSVGGMYISADAEDIIMFIDEKPVENMRIFQRAAYIQNLEAGVHKIHVQRESLQTWTKELPVFSHIVTEAYAFNMPIVPQIRTISPWHYNGAEVYFVLSTTTPLFPNASTTNSIYATTTVATSTYSINTEHEYVASLFGTSTATNTDTVLDRAVETIEQKFSFATTTIEATTTATTTKKWQDVKLFESDGEVYVSWEGETEDIPYYYCATYTSPATTSLLYGAHVYEAMVAQLVSSVDFLNPDVVGERLCRKSIRIDRKNQKVLWFDFYPDSSDWILMLLENGLYVVEADDRSWQNTQMLYPGEHLDVALEGGQIFVFDGENYFEVLTKIDV